MKKLIIASTILASTVAVSGGSSVQAAAANPGTIIVSYNNQSHVYELSATAVVAAVGDTIQVNNTTQNTIDVGTDVGANAGILSVGQQACNPLQTHATCIVTSGNTTTYTVTQLGVITVKFSNSSTLTFTVGAGGGPTGPVSVVKGSFDPNGGECVWDGLKKTFTDDFFAIGYFYAPGAAECSRPGYVFADWVIKGSSPSTSAGLPVLVHEPDKVRRHFVAQSGDYVAQWQKATASFDLAGGSCRIDGVVRAGWSDVLTDAQGKSLSTGDVVRLPAPEACSKDGARLVGWTSAITGDIVTASGATYVAQWVANNPTITITGERTTVSGKPGICVDGITTGFSEGETVIPYFRFPGETQYSQGSARPVVGTDGTFTWCRKTGKKFYAYFTSADGRVTSNRIIIAAQ